MRIQRKRSRGWRMPEGAVYCGRPTKWGNPYWHIAKHYSVEQALAMFRMTASGLWLPELGEKFAIDYYEVHRAWLARIGGHPVEVIRSELRGKTLACWCRQKDPCHVDVLLEIANG